MTLKEITFKLEELEMKSWTLNSLTLAVSDAITEGPNAASNFHGALHALTCLTYELEQEMKILKDALFELIKTERKEAA